MDEATKEAMVSAATEPPREKKEKPKKEVTNTINCPECSVPNAVSRVTCEVCGSKLRDSRKELEKRMWEMSKRLSDQIKLGDRKGADKIRKEIAKAVATTKGEYKTDSGGYPVKTALGAGKKKSLGIKGSGAPKKSHQCPCCGATTNPGSYFIMGHDGRVHGILTRMKMGTLKKTEVKSGIQKMYDKYTGKESMKQLAEMVGL